jgi:oligoribonuclease (3'-5' exoribonuclease)
MYQWISVEIDRKKMKTGMNKIPTLQLLRFLDVSGLKGL